MIDPSEFRVIRNGSMRSQVVSMAQEVVSTLGSGCVREVVFVPERGDDLGVAHFVCNGLPYVEISHIADRCLRTSGVSGLGVRSSLRPACVNTPLIIKSDQDVSDSFTTTVSVFIDESDMRSAHARGKGARAAGASTGTMHKRTKGMGVVDADRLDGIHDVSIRASVAKAVDRVLDFLDAHSPSRVSFTPETGDNEAYVCLVYPGALLVGDEVTDICADTDGVSSVGVRTTVLPGQMNKELVLLDSQELGDLIETTISIFVDETLLHDATPTPLRAAVGSKRKR